MNDVKTFLFVMIIGALFAFAALNAIGTVGPRLWRPYAAAPMFRYLVKTNISQEELAALGSEGWELVSVVRQPERTERAAVPPGYTGLYRDINVQPHTEFYFKQEVKVHPPKPEGSE